MASSFCSQVLTKSFSNLFCSLSCCSTLLSKHSKFQTLLSKHSGFCHSIFHTGIDELQLMMLCPRGSMPPSQIAALCCFELILSSLISCASAPAAPFQSISQSYEQSLSADATADMILPDILSRSISKSSDLILNHRPVVSTATIRISSVRVALLIIPMDTYAMKATPLTLISVLPPPE